MNQGTTLRDARDGGEELPEQARLRLVVDLLGALDPDEELRPRLTTSRCRFERVRVAEDGTASLDGDGDASGIAVLAWEVLAGRAAEGAEDALPRVHDLVDAVPPDVDDLIAALLGGSSDVTTVGELVPAFTDAAGGAMGSARDVREAFAPTPTPAPVVALPDPPPAPVAVRAAPIAAAAPEGDDWPELDALEERAREASERPPPPVAPSMPPAAVPPSRPGTAPPPSHPHRSGPRPFSARVMMPSEPPIAGYVSESSFPPAAPKLPTARPPAEKLFEDVARETPRAPSPLPRDWSNFVAEPAPDSAAPTSTARRTSSETVSRTFHDEAPNERAGDWDFSGLVPASTVPPPPRAALAEPTMPAPATSTGWDLKAATTPAADAPGVALQPLVLLVKNGETENGELATKIRSAGYSLITRQTAADGIQCAAQVLPDVMVIDFDLPDETGDVLVRRIRGGAAKLAATPVVLMAGPADTRTRIARFATGADVCLLKTPRFGDVVGQIAALVNMQTRLRAARQALPYLRSTGEKVFAGDLAIISISAMLTILEMERRSGVFDVRCDGKHVQLEIVAGRMTAGVALDHQITPLDALRIVLRWRTGSFAFHTIPLRAPPADAPSITALLGEALRLQDEEDHPEAAGKR